VGTTVRIPFEVTGWEPEPLELGEPGAVAFGRVTLRKTFSGPLAGTSTVAMTSAAVGEAPVGYVAVELVTGTLDGRSGSFVLQHTGTMTRGTPSLSITVVPDSGTGALTGLTGTMAIIMTDGTHAYEFDYALPIAAPG